MTQQAPQEQKPEETSDQNPLETLSLMLKSDMQNVNSMIITHMQSDVNMIPQLAGYLIASGGKRIRPLLTCAATALFEGEMSRAHKLAAAVEFIHTATLLHDDVVDGSEARRGKKAANLVFGNQASVLVGDFLFSRAFQLMVADGSIDILRILSDASATISEGEVRQLTTANNLNTTMEDYIAVISAKTAALFSAACEIGPVIAEKTEKAAAMHAYGLNLGIAFQIIDDVLDYNADREKLGKTIGDDFREGKMTAPIMLALPDASEEEMSFWERTIAKKEQKEEDLKEAIEILNKHGALEKSVQLAEQYGEKAQKALEETGAKESQPALFETLSKLISFTITRAY